MSVRSIKYCALAFISCVLASHAATVSFQDRNYEVSIIPLANNVPAAAGCDLIFVILPTNQKLLCIPSNANERACFDPNVQRFYRLDRSNGLINAFTALNGALINTDGTFFQTRTETPPLNGGTTSSLESYSIPLGINPNITADIAILDDATIAYRSSETKIYEISRDPSSFVKKTTDITDPPLVAPGNVAVDFDIENGTVLMVEPAVNDASNAPLPDRISSYFRDGTKFSEIILDNNPAIPGYLGNASGIAFDVDNGDIYVLDGNHLILFKVLRPSLTAVTPNKGPAAGNITVTVKGQNIPPDAIVFFDNIQATNILVNSSASLTCTVPPHALGSVDVTMTGTGIVVGQPVTLSNAFTYANSPPVAVLQASPNQGPQPLAVSFNTAGSADFDGTLVQRILDFGDGITYTFPADLSVTTATHTYTINGTYTATLTVTDDGGATGKDNQVIVVGTGGVDIVGVLVLRKLSMKIQPPPVLEVPGRIVSTGTTVTGDGTTFLTSFSVGELIVADVPVIQGNPAAGTQRQYQYITAIDSDTSLTIAHNFQPDITSKIPFGRTVRGLNGDQIKITGEIVLPLGITPDTLAGGILTIVINGDQVTPDDLTLGPKAVVKFPQEKFSMRAIKTRGFAPGTYTFTYSRVATNIPNVLPQIVNGRAQIPIVVSLFTPLGRSLSFVKTGANQAVVQVKSGKRSSSISLVRR
jgi:PKD repeat protein